MIIYTGRFQPFHNGHLSLINTLQKEYPNQIICIGIIKSVPIQNKSNFDKEVDTQLSDSKNPFDAETVLHLIDIVLQQEGLKNVVTTLMPRASQETWPTICAMFDCERVWAFTENRLQVDEWEQKKAAWYADMGENTIHIPIEKNINGTDIRTAIQEGNFDSLAPFVPIPILDYLKNAYK